MDKPLTTPKNKEGRPLTFKTVKEMKKVIDEYFNFCDNRIVKGYNTKEEKDFAYISPAPYTMHGLANALKIDRRTLLDYSKRDKFLPTIKEARNKVAEDVETRLMEGKAQAGAIFNLKNNFGWKDENKTDITTDGEPLRIIFGAEPFPDDNSNDINR